MKKKIIFILMLLFVLTGCSSDKETNNEESSNQNIYDVAPQVTTAQIYDENEGVNYYYFYAESCSHCQEIKPEMTSFYNYTTETDGINLYLIDGETNPDAYDQNGVLKNQDLSTEQKQIDYYNSTDDAVFSGTPTLVEVTDGEITAIKSGSVDVPAYLKEQYNIS